MNRGDPEWVNGEVIAYAWLVDYSNVHWRAQSSSRVNCPTLLREARKGVIINQTHAPNLMG
jgi:hypothetical protein